MARILILVAVAISLFFFNQYRQSQERVRLLENPQEAAAVEAAKLTLLVGKLMTLPSDETPTIATVTDQDKLKDQAFFQKAENGDKVLIYTQAKRAILYRPSTNKIIDVAPVNIGTSSATPVTPAPARVAIYNGTKTAGVATAMEKDLKGKMSNIEVVSKDNAKNDYPKTIVIDLTGNHKSVAEELAIVVNGEIGTFPQGETKPADADILIIIGE